MLICNNCWHRGYVRQRFIYDNLDQLVREDNAADGKTYVYAYDNAGNILSKKAYSFTAADAEPSGEYTEISYGYAESGWKDMLTSYNGSSITYDAIGNPLQYHNGFNFTWEGRRLIGATKGSNTYSFTYNEEGIRTSKTVNGVTTTYYLNGSQIIGEETNGNITVYLYDSTGSIIGMQYHGATDNADVWHTYWFEKNIFGDVVAVYDQSGMLLVTYSYDAWGNFTVTDEYSIETDPENNVEGRTLPDVVLNNPFRYRGYYYDTDLGLYYLNSRYYDSEVGRFINADVYVSTGQGIIGNNMFAYCGNNPIMYVDYTGEWGISVAIGGTIGGIFIIGGLLVCATKMMEQADKPKSPSPEILGNVRETLGVLFELAKLQIAEWVDSKEEEKTSIIPPTPKQTYYHITTRENAEAIMSGGIMIPRKWECGYIFAWKKCPDIKAAKDSGAHGNVIISFSTTASFENDPAFPPSTYAYNFYPVRTVFPNIIIVSDVKIVKELKR